MIDIHMMVASCSCLVTSPGYVVSAGLTDLLIVGLLVLRLVVGLVVMILDFLDGIFEERLGGRFPIESRNSVGAHDRCVYWS